MDTASHQLGGPDGRVLIVRVPADLNHDSAESLRALVSRHLPNREGAGVVLDLADVRLITSIGIAALLQIDEFCRDRRAPLVLAAISPMQLGFLRMLKLDKKFRHEPSLDDAVRRAANHA